MIFVFVFFFCYIAAVFMDSTHHLGLWAHGYPIVEPLTSTQQHHITWAVIKRRPPINLENGSLLLKFLNHRSFGTVGTPFS